MYSHTYCVLHFHSCTWNGTATLSKGLGHFKSQYFSVICTNLLKLCNCRCASIRHASRDRMQRSSHIKRAKMDDAATRNIIWHSAASGTSAVTGPSGRVRFTSACGTLLRYLGTLIESDPGKLAAVRHLNNRTHALHICPYDGLSTSARPATIYPVCDIADGHFMWNIKTNPHHTARA